MTPAQLARQIDREEFKAESAAALARALEYSKQCRENEARKSREWVTNAKSAKVFSPTRQPAKVYTFSGKTQTLMDWSAEIGVATITLRQRLRDGWPIERALSEPVAAKASRTDTKDAPAKRPGPSNPKTYEFDGRTLTLTQWAEETGIPRITLYQRLHDGWAFDRAITTPHRKAGQHSLPMGCSL